MAILAYAEPTDTALNAGIYLRDMLLIQPEEPTGTLRAECRQLEIDWRTDELRSQPAFNRWLDDTKDMDTCLLLWLKRIAEEG